MTIAFRRTSLVFSAIQLSYLASSLKPATMTKVTK